MKKIINSFIFFYLINGFCLNLNAQKNAWHIFQPNSSYPNVQFSGSNYTPNLGTNFPELFINPTTPFTNYLATNMMTDDEGKILFTVISTLNGVYLFDINNTLVGGQPLTTNQGSKEIAIVPINKGVIYHILTAGKIWQYDLSTFTVIELSQTTGFVKINAVGNQSYYDANIAVRLKYFNNDPNECITGYTCYWIEANPTGGGNNGPLRNICKIDYTITNNGNYGYFGNYSTFDIAIVNGYSTSFWAHLTEFEISPDGSKIAFADDQKVFIYELYSNGYVSNFYRSLTFGQTVNRRVAGIEFTPDNNNLVFSAFEPEPSGGTSYDNVYLWDFPNNNYYTFSSSSDFARSVIETGKDGKLYIAKNIGLYQLNINSLTISSKIIDILVFKTSDINKVGSPTSSLDHRIYNLPDQIDGQKLEFLNLSQTVYTIFNGKISWNKTIFVPIGVSTWTNIAHNLTISGYGKVYVLGQLNFKQTSYFSSGYINLEDMEIQFFDDAEFNIYQGAGIQLKGTTLKGMDCGLMWKGVDLRQDRNRISSSKSVFKMGLKENSGYSYIMDAYNGIKTIGKWASIEINPYSIFERNEIGMNLYGILPANITMNGVIMYGVTPLRNQSRGFNFYEDYEDYLKRTITHILINKSNVILGSMSGTKNWLHDAQHGIKAVASSLELYNSEIDQSNQLFNSGVTYWPKYGVWFNANKESNKHTLIVKGCKFYNIQQGIKIENKTKETKIYSNEFNTTYAYAIEYLRNQGGKLYIGDQNLENTFTFCNWAAIQCWENAKFIGLNDAQKPLNSEIYILNNTINNHTYATGIAVAEPVLGRRSYGKFKINNNLIGLNQRVGQGIVLKQIYGANSFKPLIDRPPLHNPDYMITENNIKYSTLMNAFYNGIFTENSNRINILENNINSGSFGDWRNVGVKCSEGLSNLIYGNIVQAGKGVLVTGNGIFSNYYCNEFNQCVNGIQLGYNVLRNKAGGIQAYDDTIHSNVDYNNPLNIYARPNKFNNRVPWGSDIDVYTNNISNNRWDFSIYPQLPLIIISIAPMPGTINTIVHEKDKLNPCYESNPIVQSVVNQISIDYNNINDSITKYKLKYAVNRYNQEGQTTQWVNDANIIAIQKMEDSIQYQRYVGAKSILENFTPVSAIDSATKTVFSIWINNRLQLDTTWLGQTKLLNDTTWIDSVNYDVQSIYIDTVSYSIHHKQLTDDEVEILTNIAELDATLVNPAAYPARAILWGENHLQFSDPSIPLYPNITGYILDPCIGGGDTGIEIKFYDSLGVFTGIKTKTQDSGFFIIEGTRLITLDTAMKYYISAILPNETINSNLATYKQMALQSYHIFDCSEPLNKKTSNAEHLNKNAIKIYPNPSSTGFTFTNMPDKWKITINDIVGKIIIEKEGAGNINLPSNTLPKGIYSATVINLNTNEQVTNKILVQ